MEPRHRIILSRTDALGDVILSLPTAALVKRHLPHAEVIFLARAYAQPLLEACAHVDRFIDREHVLHDPQLLAALEAQTIVHISPDQAIASLADRVRIPNRIGTSHRSFHWLRCNHLVPLGRKNSPLHEAQLNAQLLGPIDIPTALPLEDIPAMYGLNVEAEDFGFASDGRFRLILHPRSSGSAREWPTANYVKLAQALPEKDFQIFISGLAAEGEELRAIVPELFALLHVSDITGRFTLPEFMRFIASADGLVAASTGPLHIASALGKHALGLYPPIRPMHPGRWGPVGYHAAHLVRDITCNACRRGGECVCMGFINPPSVEKTVMAWRLNM